VGEGPGFDDARRSTEAVDRAFEVFEERRSKLLRVLAPHGELACQEGCSHCCKQQVSVTAVEVFRLVSHLRGDSVASRWDERVNRLRTAAHAVRGKSAEGHRGTTCPFLENDRCCVYEVRPLLCRGANSLDAEACSVPGKPIPVYAELSEAAQQLQERLDRAAHRQTGRKEMLELCNATLVAIDTEDAQTRWAAGEAVFEGARHSWFERGKLFHWSR
jgi:Fe-S-cluster containining protein